MIAWMLRFAWRWCTGLPLDGPAGRPRYRTNATWNRPGTKLLHPIPVVRWHWWRRRRRAGIRSGGTLAVSLLAWGLLGHRTWTLVILTVLTVLTAAALARPATRRVTGWRHHRTYVRPLEGGIRAELGAAPQRLMIEPDRSRVVIDLDPDFTGSPGDRAAIERAVAAKVMPELEPDWTGLDGRKPQVVFRKGEPPPPTTWADVAPVIEAAKPLEIVFGLGRKRVPVKPSLSRDSPHVGLNMGSGGGKTNTASLLMLQRLHRGDVILIIDYKLISYPWARGLPNVAYAGTIPEIHEALTWWGRELHKRNNVALAGLQPSGAIRANVGTRLFVILEELNYTVEDLKEHWAEIRKKGDPKRSPAFTGIRKGAFAGRQVYMHEVFIGQMITAAVTGSNDSSVRGNIGIACMSRYNKRTWDTMTDKPMPPPSPVHGRMQVVTAGGIAETQVPYLHLDDEDEAVASEAAKWAREYATSGIVGVPPYDMPFVGGVTGVTPRPQIEHAASDQPFVSVTSPVPPALPPTAVTLTRACELGILRCSKVAAQKRSHRPGFPEPVGWDGTARVWDALQLQAYETGRVKVLR